MRSLILTPGLSFTEAGHVYSLDGERIFGCTGVIRALGFVDDRWFTEASARRGSAVHEACWYLDEGDLDWSSLDGRIAGYVSAWERFKTEMLFEPEVLPFLPHDPATVNVVCAEVIAASLLYRFAARTDRVGPMGRVRPLRAVVEIKTGEPGDAAALQTAAQAVTLEEAGLPVTFRYAVQLRPDGSYVATPHKNHRADREDFLAAVRVLRRLGKETP